MKVYDFLERQAQFTHLIANSMKGEEYSILIPISNELLDHLLLLEEWCVFETTQDAKEYLFQKVAGGTAHYNMTQFSSYSEPPFLNLRTALKKVSQEACLAYDHQLVTPNELEGVELYFKRGDLGDEDENVLYVQSLAFEVDSQLYMSSQNSMYYINEDTLAYELTTEQVHYVYFEPDVRFEQIARDYNVQLEWDAATALPVFEVDESYCISLLDTSGHWRAFPDVIYDLESLQ